jgi:hypothetical protein
MSRRQGEMHAMSLFSRRFWRSLVAYDRRLKDASTGYELAARRFRTSRKCMTQDAQLEFRLDFVDAVRDLRQVVGELRAFNDRHESVREPQ